jgi:hypothetical protein
MDRRPPSMSVLVRASVDEALEGRLVAVVEAIDTGERRLVSDLGELMAWIQLGAHRRAALDEIAVDHAPDAGGAPPPSALQSDG